jgi:chromosome partitioning protein
VAIHGAPPKRQEVESCSVTYARDWLGEQQIPVWGGQVTLQTSFSLALAESEGAKEYYVGSLAAAEIARLWLAIEKLVKANNGVREGAALHRIAA